MADTPEHPVPARPEERPEGRAAQDALTAFTPVPRQKDRSNGWKPQVQRAFIEALAETGSVQAACRRVGRATHGVYALRRHPQAEEFRRAWDTALDFGIRRIEDAAMDRALYGSEEQVFYHGDLKAVRRRYNERLVMFMLRNRAPERFAAGGGSRGLSASDKTTLDRLKKQWREDWQREQLARDLEEEEEVRASLDRLLEGMRSNRLGHMSPAQRERQIAADAQARADEASGWHIGEPYAPFADKAAELLPGFIEAVAAGWPVYVEPQPPEWEADAGDPAAPAPAPTPLLPSPPQPHPNAPRVRSLKEDGW